MTAIALGLRSQSGFNAEQQLPTPSYTWQLAVVVYPSRVYAMTSLVFVLPLVCAETVV
jgi:hypothetical protein